MTILIFIVVLLVVVLVHEWGHFFVAKKCNMQVDEFGFGIPPRVWSWKNKNTVFSLNALPIGGFVKIAGEQPNEKRTDVTPDRLFSNRPRYQQALVLVAGVVCNFLLGWFLFSLAYGIGVPQIAKSGTPEIVEVAKGSPADLVGLERGDKLLKAIVGRKELVAPNTLDLQDALKTLVPGSQMTLLIERNGEVKELKLKPALNEERMVHTIGIVAAPIEMVKYPIHQALYFGLKKTLLISWEILKVYGSLFANIFRGQGGLDQFVGPVGLVTAVGDAADIGAGYLLYFIGFISLNLAVLNLLPFPALDGGRLVIVGLEALFGQKFNPKIVSTIHVVGFLLLLVLMAFLVVQDIGRLVVKS